MQKGLLLFFSFYLFSLAARAQCNPAFTYTVNQNQVSFHTTDTVQAVKHRWDFGDGGSDFYSQHPYHNYSQPGQYTVLHVVKDSLNNCIDSVAQVVTLNFTPNCQVDFVYASPPASGQYYFYPSISITGSTLWAISWTINGVPVSDQQGFSYTFTQAGSYNVCVRIQSGSGCIAEQCHTINYQPYTNCNLGVSFTQTADPIQPRLISFTALPDQPSFRYSWRFGDGAQAGGRTVSHLYPGPGTYLVTLYVTDSLLFCRDSVSGSVQVAPPPSQSCTASFTYTTGQQGEVSFTAISNQPVTAQTWTIYNTRDSLSPVVITTANPVYTFTDTGYYYVCLSLTTNTGCTTAYCDAVRINDISGRSASTIPSYPNPVTSEAAVRFRIILQSAGLITYKVYNLTGRAVYQSQYQGQPGINTISVPVQQMNRGQYFIDISAGNYRRRSTFQKL